MELTREEKIELTRKEFKLKPKDLYLKNNKIYLCGKPLNKWHKEMWEWMVEKGDENTHKREFIYEHFNNLNVIKLLERDSYCFGCLYVSLVEDENNDEPCAYCPLCEYEESKSMGCLGGLYHLYKKCLTISKSRRDVAYHIANLKWEW